MAYNQPDMVSGEQYRYALTNFVSLGRRSRRITMLYVVTNASPDVQ